MEHDILFVVQATSNSNCLHLPRRGPRALAPLEGLINARAARVYARILIVTSARFFRIVTGAGPGHSLVARRPRRREKLHQLADSQHGNFPVYKEGLENRFELLRTREKVGDG